MLADGKRQMCKYEVMPVITLGAKGKVAEGVGFVQSTKRDLITAYPSALALFLTSLLLRVHTHA